MCRYKAIKDISFIFTYSNTSWEKDFLTISIKNKYSCFDRSVRQMWMSYFKSLNTQKSYLSVEAVKEKIEQEKNSCLKKNTAGQARIKLFFRE